MLAHRMKKYTTDLFSPQCELCGLTIGTSARLSWLCEYCELHFLPQSRCSRCGLPTVIATLECGTCLRTPPLWQRLYCVGDYQAPLSSYVHKLKYQGQFWQASKLAQLLAVQIEQPAELITCVPLHWRRHWLRGFNQSEMLAISLADKLERPYQSLFRRVRATSPQLGKNRRQRLANLRNAYIMNRSLTAKHVAIVDDVLTTGSTVQQLCKLLLDAGVKTIDIYTICRTPEPSEKR